jgi:hypothetical protein
MTKRPKSAQPTQSTTHPETKKHVSHGVPGASSSKAHGKGRDTRSGHDKDGNEEQAKIGGARG